jgi:hypothetical protein
MKIAIVSSVVFHIECLGFLLHSLSKDHEISIFTPLKSSYGYEEYFHTIYKNVHLKDIKELTEDNHDVYIKLTAHDKFVCPGINKKTISIIHLSRLTDGSCFKITLSPYVKTSDCFVRVMPLYKGLTMTHKKMTRKILWVGQLEDSWIDEDMKMFISSANFDFTFVISTGKGIGKPLKQMNLKNLRIINRMPTENLIKHILNCDMIMCRKLPYQKKDRYSGCLTLGLSHDKPLILNKEIAKDYDIPGILFGTRYCEVLSYVNTLTSEKLKKSVEKVTISRIKHARENSKCLNRILKQVVSQ